MRTGGVCARVMSTKGGLDGVHAPLDPRLVVFPRDGSTFSFSSASSASSAASHRPRRNTTPPRRWRSWGWWSCRSSSTSRRATRARGLAYVRTSTVTEVAASSTRRALNIVVVVVASPSHAASMDGRAGVFPPRARRFGFKFKRGGKMHEKGGNRRGGRGGEAFVRWMDGDRDEVGSARCVDSSLACVA